MAASSARSAPSTMTSTSHPPRHHHRNKKGSDPFLELPSDNSTAADMPSTTGEHEGPANQSNSFVTDLVFAPLIMVSFVISLFLVDKHNRQWRLSQHAPSNADSSFWSRLTHWASLDPQPYQDHQTGSWKRQDTAAAQNNPATAYQGWYVRKKHRAVAKMEISDAFEMRKTVVVALATWAAVGLCVLSYAAKKTYGWLAA